MNKFFTILISVCAVSVVSCNNDDEPKMPVNAISLNMMTGDSETTIGGSDVYINTSNNFTSNNCCIADLGKRGGFTQNPDLSQIAREVAVAPGDFYQITLAGDIRTIAGARALPVNTSYYNVYVDSWIYDKNNDVSGAKVKYAECFPSVSENVLPQWGTTFPVYLKSWDNQQYEESAKYTFDKNVKIDSEYTIYDVKGSYSELSRRLDVTVSDNEIKFSNSAYTPDGKAEVIVNVRYGSLYSQVHFLVSSSVI